MMPMAAAHKGKALSYVGRAQDKGFIY